MKAAKDDRRAESRRRRAIAALAESDPELAAADLVLPAEEVRRLVLQIILADEVAPFARRMVDVIDDLRAGRTGALTRAARQNKNRPLSKLLASIAHAAERGHRAEAEATALYAASYAYRNSLDYFRSLLSYLDGLRRRCPLC
jgi:hypothetical protein